MKLTESRSPTLEGQTCLQQAKHAMRYSDLFRTSRLQPLTSRSGFSSSERERERERETERERDRDRDRDRETERQM